MILVANILIALGHFLRILIYTYWWLIFARCILSFVSPDPRNPIVQFISATTEPSMSFVRRKIPLSIGMFDLSPILILALLTVLDIALAQSLIDYGAGMRSAAMISI